MGAKKGNTNAKIGVHPGIVIRLDVPATDLLYEYFASQGNPEPSRDDLQNAVYYALRQVYDKQMERDTAIIL